jgi:hypothetical protein
MIEFKFLRGYVGTLNVMDGETYATASLNDDTPEGHMNRRMLYHTNHNLLDNVRREIPRGRFGTPERHQDILRRLQMTNDSRDLNDNPIRLFQTTSVTTVNPKWWMKIKMFFQEANFNGEILGIIFIAGSLTIGVILGIAKLLNAW